MLHGRKYIIFVFDKCNFVYLPGYIGFSCLMNDGKCQNINKCLTLCNFVAAYINTFESFNYGAGFSGFYKTGTSCIYLIFLILNIIELLLELL